MNSRTQRPVVITLSDSIRESYNVATLGPDLGTSFVSIKSILPNLLTFGSNRSKDNTRNPKGSNDATPRIMVVDDEKDISSIFKTALERAGFIVEEFNDPQQALSEFRPGYYDLLLLDVRMPQMTGFELFSEISKRDQKIKACFISGFQVYEEELLKYLPKKGEDCIIKKPVSMRDLVKLVKEELSSDRM